MSMAKTLVPGFGPVVSRVVALFFTAKIVPRGRSRALSYLVAIARLLKIAVIMSSRGEQEGPEVAKDAKIIKNSS